MKKLLPALLLVLLGCSQKPDNAWLGYGEGDFAFIAAPQPGWVTRTEGRARHR